MAAHLKVGTEGEKGGKISGIKKKLLKEYFVTN